MGTKTTCRRLIRAPASQMLMVACIFMLLVESSAGSKARHFKWDVEYVFWSPDCVENVVMGINGQFPGPTIRAKAGDTVVIDLTNKLHTEGVVIHWHGIRQVLCLSLSPSPSLPTTHHPQSPQYDLLWI